MRLTLRDDLYFCVADGHLVFLDVRNDRYRAAPPSCAEAFQRLQEGGNPSDPDASALAPLIASGWLVQGDNPRQMRPASPAKPRYSVNDVSLPRPDVTGVCDALRHQAAATLQLQTTPLLKLLDRLTEVKHKRSANRPPTEASVLRLASSFLATRCLFSAQDKCLRDSLALTRFLAVRGVNPRLTLGVQMRPFAAHAWVEWEDWVLNDSVERLRPYTPILRV